MGKDRRDPTIDRRHLVMYMLHKLCDIAHSSKEVGRLFPKMYDHSTVLNACGNVVDVLSLGCGERYPMFKKAVDTFISKINALKLEQQKEVSNNITEFVKNNVTLHVIDGVEYCQLTNIVDLIKHYEADLTKKD